MGDNLISILTLVSGREKAFRNFLEGLKRSSMLPFELIVVFMNQEPSGIPDLPFMVKYLKIIDETPLPLSAARNMAAKEASGDLLIFLDVDCIPDTNLISYYSLNKQPKSLLVGPVRYLENKADEHSEFFESLMQLSTPDFIRENVNPLPYELFWSLNFACTKSTYNTIGGFDEDFKGYGGEDTDFSFKARESQIKITLINALAFHQYHPSYSPPLNHFMDIIANARLFYKKWKTWPMEGWLRKFEQIGLILRKPGEIEVLRTPEKCEIEQAVKY